MPPRSNSPPREGSCPSPPISWANRGAQQSIAEKSSLQHWEHDSGSWLWLPSVFTLLASHIGQPQEDGYTPCKPMVPLLCGARPSTSEHKEMEREICTTGNTGQETAAKLAETICCWCGNVGFFNLCCLTPQTPSPANLMWVESCTELS